MKPLHIPKPNLTCPYCGQKNALSFWKKYWLCLFDPTGLWHTGLPQNVPAVPLSFGYENVLSIKVC